MTSTTEQVWDYLLKSGLTAEGAAGLMGNLKAESGIIPNRVEILCLKRLREHGRTYSDQSYTAAVDSGAITKSEFLHPIPGKQYGYGIAQWTSPNRKAGLYDLAQSKGVSIGDLDTQLEYLIRELNTSYKPVYSVLISTNSVQTASDAVLTHFEQPANAQSMKQERANYGYQYFNQFASSKGDDPVSTVTAGKILDIYRSWIGYSEANGKHKKIVDLYNSHKPLARGYAVKYSDSWCDTCLSAAFIKAGAVTLIGGTECGVEEHIKIFKKSGIWIEDGTITPKMGDIIVYNWDQKTQPNDGYADHIGIVESVSGNMITTIEGNYKDAVGRRVIPVGWGYIRGYARPRYAAEAQQKVYHVQAATYTDRKYADQLVLKLKSYGIDSYSYQKSGYWLVQAGAYASKANADAMLKRLQDLGISGMIWK
ncbi:phage tail tip lysozyme [Porcincola intestinalis]|nr:phage tail tip lysozyme [Porcincola intestinalis]